MNPTGYAFLGLTIIVATLVAVLVFALLRFAAAARDARRALGHGGSDSTLLAAALEDAVARLKAQERATAARAEASERLNTQIVESLTSGLVVVDAERRILIVNPAARRILDLPPGTLSSRDLLEALPALDDLIAESLRGNAPVVRRQISVMRGGAPMHLGVTVTPFTIDASTRGAICLFSDLTAVVALEEQLRLKEALARLGELTAGLAHEFRNGLATIHGYGRLLDPESLAGPQKRYVEGIRAETDALREVVENFLRFARPEPLALGTVDLAALVARAAEDVPLARVNASGVLGVIDGDEVLLRQAISNLFRNSVEACQAVGRTAEIEVHGDSTPDGASVVLAISDNGPGLPPDAIDKVFQPFFTTRPGGTGLGLAIVQKVIVSHNGRVTAGNGPGGGALFTIRLPARAAAGAPALL